MPTFSEFNAGGIGQGTKSPKQQQREIRTRARHSQSIDNLVAIATTRLLVFGTTKLST
ncbi:MAG: hypothetical protein QOF83_4103 [Solirubrobacteraceae bacterium]|jgi:hypothetical protein|nr:hypothetical protein [Solirubrobacteraceae bacterium]